MRFLQPHAASERRVEFVSLNLEKVLSVVIFRCKLSYTAEQIIVEN